MVVVVLVVEQTMPSNTQKTDVHGVCETYIYETSREQRATNATDRQSNFDSLEIEVRVESWWRRGRPKNKQTTKGGDEKKRNVKK